MACSDCEYKGYISRKYYYNGKEHDRVNVCPTCNDIRKYSLYIKEKYAVPEENIHKRVEEKLKKDNVIPFRRRK